MFIIKLNSDKRVLVRVYVCVVYGTYWQEGLRRKKGSTRGAEPVLPLCPPPPLSPLHLPLNTNDHTNTHTLIRWKVTRGAHSSNP